jgi:hypothetical protein
MGRKSNCSLSAIGSTGCLHTDAKMTIRALLSIIAVSLLHCISAYVKSPQQAFRSLHVALRGSTHAEAVVRSNKSVKNLHDGMKIRRLPHSDLQVSEICLGTLNFGDQLNEAQSTAILDSAFGDYGINFLVSSYRRNGLYYIILCMVLLGFVRVFTSAVHRKHCRSDREDHWSLVEVEEAIRCHHLWENLWI